MKKLLFLFLGLTLYSSVTSCRKEDETENPALFNNADKYIKDSDGNKYQLSSASLVGKKAKNATETNQYTITLQGNEGNVSRTVVLDISFPFNDKLVGGFSTTSSIRFLSDTKSKFTRDTTVLSNFALGTFSIEDLDAHNYKVIFTLKTQSGEIITGSYNGQFTVVEN
jgi:hypothetical protein